MDSNNNPGEGMKTVSWELLTLLLSPGGQRIPLVELDEITRILELSDQPEPDALPGRQDTARPQQYLI